HRGMVDHVAFSTDGRRILTRSSDRAAHVWDADTGAELALFAVPDLRGAVLSLDGEHVFTATDTEIKIWRTRTPDLELELANHTMPIGASFSPDGRRIAIEDRRQIIRIWDRTSGRLERELNEFDLGDDSRQSFGIEMTKQRKLPTFDATGRRLFAPVGNRVAA